MNWQKIKNEYVTGSVTYRELAEKYGLAHGTVRAHAASEGWRAARKIHRQKVSELTEEKAADKIADAESDISAIKARTRVLIFKELENRLNGSADLDGADFRRLVQSYIDLIDSEEDRPSGETNELLRSLQELFRDNKENDL